MVQAGQGRAPQDWAEGDERPKDEKVPLGAYVISGHVNTGMFYLGADDPVGVYLETVKDGSGKDVWAYREWLTPQFSDKTGDYWVYKAANSYLWYFPKKEQVYGSTVPLVYFRRPGGPLVLYGIGQWYPITVHP
jgi:hypothetical protein